MYMGTTTREEIIAFEQKAVDRAYDCYAARLAEMTGGSVACSDREGSPGRRSGRVDGTRSGRGHASATVETVGHVLDSPRRFEL